MHIHTRANGAQSWQEWRGPPRPPGATESGAAPARHGMAENRCTQRRRFPIMVAVSNQGLAPSRLVPVTAATSLDPACLIQPAIALDSADTPRDVIDALILAAFADGSQPFARTARLQEVRRDAAIVPAGATVLRAA